MKISDSPTAISTNVFGEPTSHGDDDENTTGHSGNTPETSLGLTNGIAPLDVTLGDEYTYVNTYNLDHAAGSGADLLSATGGGGGFTGPVISNRRFMNEIEDFEQRKRPKYAGAA